MSGCQSVLAQFCQFFYELLFQLVLMSHRFISFDAISSYAYSKGRTFWATRRMAGNSSVPNAFFTRNSSAPAASAASR